VHNQMAMLVHMEVISYLERMPYTLKYIQIGRDAARERRVEPIMPAFLLAGAPETLARPTSRSI
jgi:hypothetical protein